MFSGGHSYEDFPLIDDRRKGILSSSPQANDLINEENGKEEHIPKHILCILNQKFEKHYDRVQ